MKHEIGIRMPDCVVEDWPSKYDAFSWLEYVISAPNPIGFATGCLRESLAVRARG